MEEQKGKKDRLAVKGLQHEGDEGFGVGGTGGGKNEQQVLKQKEKAAQNRTKQLAKRKPQTLDSYSGLICYRNAV